MHAKLGVQFHFSENSQRHHSAADASVYLVNIKRQLYYAHRQKKIVLNQITYPVCMHKMSVRKVMRGTTKYAVFR
jgi:hypothetical protein